METGPQKNDLPDSIKNAKTFEELKTALDQQAEAEGRVGTLHPAVAKRQVEMVENMKDMLNSANEISGMIADQKLADIVCKILGLTPLSQREEMMSAGEPTIMQRTEATEASISKEETHEEGGEMPTMIMSVGMFNESPSEEFKKVLNKMESLDELAKWIDSQDKLPAGTRVSTANTVRSLKQNWATVLANKIPLLVRETVLRLAEKEGYRDRIK